MSTTQAPARFASLSPREWIKRAILFLAVAFFLGCLHGLVSPRMFPQDRLPGFGYGMLHGGLMPMALPSLVMGNNVEIFATNNSGRSYKVGYIVGINLCGLVFFGSAFWKPAKKVKATSSDKSQ